MKYINGEIEKADLNFIIAGSSDAIMMVEGGANVVPEDEVLAALMFGHDKIKEIINLQNQKDPQVNDHMPLQIKELSLSQIPDVFTSLQQSSKGQTSSKKLPEILPTDQSQDNPT